MLNYTLNVVSSYVMQLTDGTLWTLKQLEGDRDAVARLYRDQPEGYLQIIPMDTRTRTLPDYKALTRDAETWTRFETARLEPCFHHVPDFHPFEQPVALGRGTGAVVDAFEERQVSPGSIVRLSLGKIEHRFPRGDDDLPGDTDIRDMITAQTHVFHHNYRHLNRRRVANVRGYMRAAQGLQALWTVWFVEDIAEGRGPLHAGLAVLGVNPDGANAMLSLVGNPFAFLVFTVVVYAVLAALAGYFHTLHRQRFGAFTRSSSATVSKSVTSRQDNLVYLTRAMIEEIDRGKEEAWDGNRQKTWATETQKWASLVFWCDQRIEANEEHLRLNMKLMGLAYTGERSRARFHALLLVFGHLLLALTVAGGLALTVVLLGWMSDMPVIGAGAACYALATAAFVVLLLRLHGLVRAIDPPQSVDDMVQWSSTRYMKGWRDSALYREVAEFITRDKRRLLHEEEKRRVA